MIPASSIHDNRDGTMWWVPRGDPDKNPMSGVDHLDRPCDTCGGHRYHLVNGGPAITGCDARCANGRHNFDIEVGEGERYHSVVYRVSVVEVLPIYAWQHPMPHGMTFPCLILMPRGYVLRAESESFSDGFHIDLPADAEPGMIAVQLNVHQEET